MRRFFRLLLPRRIAAQSAAVVVGVVVLVHLAIIAHFRLLADHAANRHRSFAHVGTVVRMIAGEPSGERRESLVARTAAVFPQLDLKLDKTPPEGLGLMPPPPDWPGGPAFGELEPDMPVVEVRGPVRTEGPVRALFAAAGKRRFAVGLDNGDWLRLTDQPPPPPPFFVGPFGTSVIFAGLSSVVLGLWAAWGLVGPLRALAAAAHDFDVTAEVKPLPKRGPEEVRVVARAFEAMRRRTRTLLEDRTRMLAAMSHDLRTPITRLRLRSEFVADDVLRAEIQRDLAGMNAMIEGALAYLADGRRNEPPALVDLSAMIQTICDPKIDLGRSVVYDGPDHLVRRVRPIAIERAVSNLVDNALKYGSSCVVRLRATSDGGSVVEVEDDGPGIAAADREAMLQPFVRGDTARNMDDYGGFGLGLSIVAAVVERHRGRLSLHDAVPHGLVVRIELPADLRPPPKAKPQGGTSAAQTPRSRLFARAKADASRGSDAAAASRSAQPSAKRLSESETP